MICDLKYDMIYNMIFDMIDDLIYDINVIKCLAFGPAKILVKIMEDGKSHSHFVKI